MTMFYKVISPISLAIPKRLISRPIGSFSSSWRQFSTNQQLQKHLFDTPETKVTTLRNGLRVATESSASPTATIGIFIDAGSSSETAETNGVAHFLKRLSLKGTATRTQSQLERELENMGGTLNAYTSREHTVYTASVLKDYVGQSVDVLSDIVTNPQLSSTNIENERSAIIREIQEVENEEESFLFDHLHSIAYQDSSLGFTIFGPVENVKSITQKEMQDFINTHYSPDRIVLVGAGGVDHESVVAAAEKSFGSLLKKPLPPVSRPVFTGSLATIQDTGKEDVHLVIGTEGVEWTHPDYYVIMVLQSIVGNWNRNAAAGKNISSSLCEAIASNGFGSSISSYTTFYNQTGHFGVYAVTDPEHAFELSFSIIREWVRLSHSVTDLEVDRAKNKLKSSLISQLDGNQAICHDIGLQLLTRNSRLSPAEVLARIDEVDTAAVRNAASRYCHDSEPAIVVLGNPPVLDYNILRSWTRGFFV